MARDPPPLEARPAPLKLASLVHSPHYCGNLHTCSTVTTTKVLLSGRDAQRLPLVMFTCSSFRRIIQALAWPFYFLPGTSVTLCGHDDVDVRFF